ncbi:MAG: 50S ribosomal protein L22 [Candidatus Anammoxibacter sp.]
MEFKSFHKYASISPRKVRYVIDLVRGKSVNDALEILRATNKRASYMINKVVRSAVANADESSNVSIEDLYISVAKVDCGPIRKWHRPRSRGMMNRILKRSSHITIILSN